MTATPLVGKYQYDFSIFNNGGEDAFISKMEKSYSYCCPTNGVAVMSTSS